MASDEEEGEDEMSESKKEGDEESEQEDENSCIQVYFQAHDHTPKTSAILKLLEAALYEEMFDALRNKEQLGYYVSCSKRCSRGVYALSFEIESSNYGPKHLQERINSFVSGFIAGFTQKKFDDYRSGIETKLLEPFKDIVEESRFLKSSLFSHN